MWLKLIINILISIFLIYSFHQLWDYLRTTYSKQTTKDPIKFQTEKYKKIIDHMQPSPTSTNIPTLPPFYREVDANPLKDDLEDFVNNLQQNGPQDF